MFGLRSSPWIFNAGAEKLNQEVVFPSLFMLGLRSSFWIFHPVLRSQPGKWCPLCFELVLKSSPSQFSSLAALFCGAGSTGVAHSTVRRVRAEVTVWDGMGVWLMVHAIHGQYVERRPSKGICGLWQFLLLASVTRRCPRGAGPVKSSPI